MLSISKLAIQRTTPLLLRKPCKLRKRRSGLSATAGLSCYYPAPGRGMGYCFWVISFFVSLSATLRENGWTDLHEIFREGVE